METLTDPKEPPDLGAEVPTAVAVRVKSLNEQVLCFDAHQYPFFTSHCGTLDELEYETGLEVRSDSMSEIG